MIIGVPKEIKNGEKRVSLIPSSVKELVKNGHTVYVEKNAGSAIGFEDSLYEAVGAKILDNSAEIYSKSEIIVKVKEPQTEEFALFKTGQTIITYFHLAVEPELLEVLIKKKITAIAYETIELPDGSLPLLRPMSEIAGKMSVQIGAQYLQIGENSYGTLLGGVAGVMPAEVVVVGAGVVGLNAARVASGMGAHVTLLDICPKKLAHAEEVFHGTVATAMSNEYNLKKLIKEADLVISGVLLHSKKAPKLITEEMVKSMKKGAVIADVSIDQGGIFETIDSPTSIDDPIFEKYGVIHYAVPNIPGLVARTASISLNNHILPYVLKFANKGFIAAVKSTPELYKGVNTYQGKLTNPEVAKIFGYPFSELSMLIGF